MMIVIGNEKGGTGKTTLAINLAVIKAQKSNSLLFIDADVQGSAHKWNLTRHANKIKPEIPMMQKTGRLDIYLKKIKNKYDDIIIDTAGRDSIELRSAMLVADKLIMPLQPSQLDVWAVTEMQKVVETAKTQNKKLETIVVINRASAHYLSKKAENLKEAIQGLPDIKVSDTIIVNREAFDDAAISGNGVVELPAKTKSEIKAIKETQSLFIEVY